LKRQFISLGAALVLFTAAVVGIASAQTTPPATTTSTTTTDTTGPYVAQAGGKAGVPSSPAPHGPFIIIHVGGMSTWNAGSSDLALPSVYCASTQDCGATGQYQFADPVAHFDYGAQINFTKKLYISYSHNYIDQNIGRVAVPSSVCSTLPCNTSGVAKNSFVIPYTYQKLNDDRVDDASLNYLAGAVTVSGGWHQRARMCCGNPVSSDLASQVYWHDIYFQLAARAGPSSKYFGRLAGLTVQEEYLPHNTNSVFKTTGPTVEVVPNAGSLYHTTVTPNLTYPIGDPRRSTFAVYATYLNNFDYFMNAPIPYLYNQVDFGIIKKWPPWVTLTLYDSNLYQHHEGYPYTNADTINRNKIIMVLDVALPIM
jgi:hypothetical protein